MMENILIIYSYGHNILRLLMFYKIFFSPQVKRSAIISNKHEIYELPHELPNDLRVPSLTLKMKILSLLPKTC